MYVASKMIKKKMLLGTILVASPQRLMSFVCKNINEEAVIWTPIVKCFGGGVAFGLSKLVLVTRLRIGDQELGEVALPCVPRSQPLIYDRGSLASNTTQWIGPKRVEVGYFENFHVYASNMIGESCATWNKILQLLLTY